MYPTLFTVGRLEILTYTIVLDLGLILALVLTYFEGKRSLRSADTALDLGLWTIIGGLIGGRIGFVLANWSSRFSGDWSAALRIWEGGLSFHGAFLGGLVVLGLVSLFQRRRESPTSFWQLADVLTLGLAVGVLFGWVACLLGGLAYGVEGQGFGYMATPVPNQETRLRFATQIFGIGQSLLLVLMAWLLRKRWPFPGAAFLMFGLLYFTGQFFLGSYRGDDAIYLSPTPWRLQQAIDLALALLAAVGLLVLWWLNRNRGEEAGESEDDAPAGPPTDLADELPAVEAMEALEPTEVAHEAELLTEEETPEEA